MKVRHLFLRCLQGRESKIRLQDFAFLPSTVSFLTTLLQIVVEAVFWATVHLNTVVGVGTGMLRVTNLSPIYPLSNDKNFYKVIRTTTC